MMKAIGDSAFVSIMGRKNVPAKIDTGADSSSIWASDIHIRRDHTLHFKLFAPKSPFYTGKVVKRTDYKVAVVRSATGHEQIRYRTHIPINLHGRTIRVLFNLSDRSRNNFPILIGKRTIAGKFLVDVTQKVVKYPKIARSTKLQQKLAQNPYKFHQKYIKSTKKEKDIK